MPVYLYEIGLLIGLTMVSTAVTIYVAYRAPVRVVELVNDPPPKAHYLQYENTESQEAKEAITHQKVNEIFYHAFTFCAGRCASRELYGVISEQWNSHYEQWPQYKNWHISKNFIEQTLAEWDFNNSGRVLTIQREEKIAHFVLIGSPRQLVNVADLVTHFERPTPSEMRPDIVPDHFISVLKTIHQPHKRTDLPIAAD